MLGVENLICQVRDTDVTEQFQMSLTPVALVVSQQENNYKYVDIVLGVVYDEHKVNFT